MAVAIVPANTEGELQLQIIDTFEQVSLFKEALLKGKAQYSNIV